MQGQKKSVPGDALQLVLKVSGGIPGLLDFVIVGNVLDRYHRLIT